MADLRDSLKMFLNQVDEWSRTSHDAFKKATEKKRKVEAASRHGEACTLEVVAAELRAILSEPQRPAAPEAREEGR